MIIHNYLKHKSTVEGICRAIYSIRENGISTTKFLDIQRYLEALESKNPLNICFYKKPTELEHIQYLEAKNEIKKLNLNKDTIILFENYHAIFQGITRSGVKSSEKACYEALDRRRNIKIGPNKILSIYYKYERKFNSKNKIDLKKIIFNIFNCLYYYIEYYEFIKKLFNNCNFMFRIKKQPHLI